MRDIDTQKKMRQRRRAREMENNSVRELKSVREKKAKNLHGLGSRTSVLKRV